MLPQPSSRRTAHPQTPELLAASENQLQTIVTATRRPRRPLRGIERIALQMARSIDRSRMAKRFDTEITEDSFSFSRDQDNIAAEAALDGIYVLRTSLPDTALTEGSSWPLRDSKTWSGSFAR